jgi:LuxR family quorum sensing-dependent transcriptional regulator
VQAQNILAHNVSPDWVREFVRRDWIKWDARLLGARFIERPYRWREVADFTPMQKEILAAAADFDMKDGLSIPVRMKRSLGGVVLSAARLKDVDELSQVTSDVSLDVLWRSLMLNGFQPDYHLGAQLFTPRQREILRYVAREMSNQEIAAACGISAETVKEMLSRMARKINVRGRVGLVAHGFRTRALY